MVPALTHIAKKKFNSMSNSSNTMKQIALTGIGLLALTGTFLLIRRYVINANTDHVSNAALFNTNTGQSNAKNMALMLNEFLQGWNVEEEGIFTVLASIPSHAVMKEVVEEYWKLKNRKSTLTEDFVDRLNDEDMRVVNAIIQHKPLKTGGLPVIPINETPDGVVQRIDEAFHWYGTDEHILFEEIAKLPSQNWYWKVVDAYEARYGENLDEKLKNSRYLYPDQLEVLTTLYFNKPKKI